MILSILLYCSLFLGTLNAQSCVILDESNACGKDYVGYPVKMQNISGTQDFNLGIRNLSLVETYSIFGCSASDIDKEQLTKVRYQSSFWCAYYVNHALENGCSAVNPKNPSLSTLCIDECRQAEESVKLLLSKCSNKTRDTRLNVRSYTKFLADTCNSSADKQKNSSSKTCAKGTEIESELCGWNSREYAMSRCQGLNTPCCEALLSSSTTVRSESISSGGMVLERWKIGLIVGGLLIVLIVVIAFFCFKRKKYSNHISTGFISKSDPKKQSNLHDSLNFDKNSQVSAKNLENIESQNQQESLCVDIDDHHLSKFIDKKNEKRKSYTSRENQLLVVIENYKGLKEDELDLKTGDLIYCITEYDDGWALGCNPVTEKQGVFAVEFTKQKKHTSYVDFLDKRVSYISRKGNISSFRDSAQSFDSLGGNPFRGKGLQYP